MTLVDEKLYHEARMRHMISRTIFLATLASLLSAEPVRQPTTKPTSRPVRDALLSIELWPSADAFAEGETIRLNPVIRNVGKRPVTILQAVDGSDIGWRAVDYEWIVTDAAGNYLQRKPRARCGNVNRVTSDDRVTIKPGESFEPMDTGRSFLGDVSDYHQLPPGEYLIRLVYRFDSSRQERGVPLGAPDPDVFTGVAELEVESAAVRVTVSRPS